MGCRLRCWVVLCLLWAVSTGTGVTQTPKHLVTGTGRNVTLKCKQHLGHNAMYWYKQSVQKPPKLLLAYNYKDLLQNGTASSRFLPDRPDNSQLDLHIGALEPEDSALYLCASSKDTALHLQFLPVHKPPGSKPGSHGGGPPTLSSTFPGGPQRSQTLLLPVGSVDAESTAQTPTPWTLALPRSRLPELNTGQRGSSIMHLSSIQSARGPEASKKPF